MTDMTDGADKTRARSRTEIGMLGEDLAVEHLRGLGLRIVDRNWRCRYGELDIVATDDQTGALIFVEVKTRTTDRYGGAIQAVTPEKLRRLRRLAGQWLAGHQGGWAEVRIDVVAISFGRDRTPAVVHLSGVA